MLPSLLVSILVATAAYAQTQTIINDAGLTVVQAVTLNDVGLPTTSIIETLAADDPPATQTTAAATQTTAAATETTAATTRATTRAVVTQAPVQQGPVGQPDQTTFTPGGITPYTYTTVVNGETQVLSDLFTPTSLQLVPTKIPASGTVWDFSQWSAVYLPKSTGSGSPNAAVALAPVGMGAGGWAGVLVSGVIAVVGGLGLLAL